MKNKKQEESSIYFSFSLKNVPSLSQVLAGIWVSKMKNLMIPSLKLLAVQWRRMFCK